MLNIAHCNVNGLNMKVPTLQYILDLNNTTDILLISETHLTPTINDAAISIPGYRLLRNDSGDTQVHGVCAYVSEKIHVDKIDASSPNVILFHLSELDMYVCVVYRPPSNSIDQNTKLIEFLLHECIDKELILIGDFNLPTIKWSSELQLSRSMSSSDSRFLDAFNALGLTQWIVESTFPRSGNILDLILTTETDRISEVAVNPPPPGCDHCSVHCQYTFDKELYLSTRSVKYHSWFKGQYNVINDILSDFDWDVEFMHLTTQEAFDHLMDILQPLIIQYVPTYDRNRHAARIPWKTCPPTSMKRKRKEAWQKYKQARTLYGRSASITHNFLSSFLEVNRQLRGFAIHSQAEYEKSLIVRARENPKLLHSYLRCKKKLRPSVGPLRLPNGSTTDNPLEMAECFSDAFASVFNSAIPDNPAPHQVSNGVLQNIEFGPVNVANVLLGLDVNSAMGPDGLHPQLLKACAHSLAYPLYKIFSLSLDEELLPTSWKLSLVVPIFKKGSHTDPLNYRPVCLPSVPAKCLERIICQELHTYLSGNDILTTNQFGFRPGRSTEDQLLITYDFVSKEVDQGKIVDVILFDFAKAFDVVCHSVLMEKLKCIGIDGKLLSWLHEFLVGRLMQVVVKDTYGTSRAVKSGVPQGSVLGPILFLIYINHIAVGLTCQYKIFADDLKIYTCINNTSVEHDTANVQSDIDLLHSTARSWGLHMNSKKCVVLRFQRRSSVQHIPNYTLAGQKLPAESLQTDLGILIDDRLKFHDHTRNVTRKAGGVAHSFLKGTVCRETEFMVHILKTHIRPILEYASPVWNTGYVQDTKRLESVQRLWTRQIKGLEEKDYGIRLNTLNLYSVKGRLLRADLIKCWKIFNGHCPIKPTDLWKLSSDQRNRGHRFKLNVNRCQIDARSRFFTERVIKDWNSLPDWAVSSGSLVEFKAALETCLADKLFSYLQ